MMLPRIRRNLWSLAALVMGVLGTTLAFLHYRRAGALEEQVEKLREGGGIVENYYPLLDGGSRMVGIAWLLIGLIGFAVGIRLLYDRRRASNASL
jgi:hypothetical protein